MEVSKPRCTLSATTEINRAPSEVWSVLGDFEEVEVWAPGLTDAYRTTGPDIDIGSRRTVRYRYLLTMEQVVTEWTEGESLTYAVFRAPWPLRNFFETWTVTPSEAGSRVTTEVAYDLWFGWLGRLVDWCFTRHVLRFEMKQGQKGLRRVVESRKP